MVIGLGVGIKGTYIYPHALFSRDIEIPTATFSGPKNNEETLQLFHNVAFMKDCILSTPKASFLLRAVFPSSSCNQASKRPCHNPSNPLQHNRFTEHPHSKLDRNDRRHATGHRNVKPYSSFDHPSFSQLVPFTGSWWQNRLWHEGRQR